MAMCAPRLKRCMAAVPLAAPSAIMCDSVAMCDTITKGSSFGGGGVVHNMTVAPEQPPRDPLLHLVSLQGASGCWLLDPALATALGKTNEEVEKSKPEKANSEVWATILALIWLHAFKIDAKDEWELLAMKAASWLRAQNALCVTECVDAGNVLLGCSVKKEALGL